MPPPVGPYSNAVASAPGRMVFIAGTVAYDAEGKVVHGEMRSASVYRGPTGECSGPASVDFFVNYIPSAVGGAGGTSP